MIWILRIVAYFLIVTAVLPLFKTGKWYVRWWDFPRLQLALIGLIVLSGLAYRWFSHRGEMFLRSENTILLLLVLIVTSWQFSHVAKFSWLWPTEVPPVSADAAGRKFRVAIVNHDYENRSFENSDRRN